MNVFTMVPLQNTEVFIPTEAFQDGSLTNPSTWPAQVATRVIYNTGVLNYVAAAWELDENGLWCIKHTFNLAAGRYELWVKVTMPTGVSEVKNGVLVVEVP